MFKALNLKTDEEIIILDPFWESRINRLRSLDRQDLLVCPGCKQPVRVRAGQIRTQHFAHKHLGNCPYGHESPTLIRARQVLYLWLHSKFEDQVTVEKAIDTGDLKRPVDCWVTTQNNPIAYWIIEVRMHPADREAIPEVLDKEGARTNWVFSIDMLREDDETPDAAHLTTTEREFMRQTEYDNVEHSSPLGAGKSLHYVDYESEVLTTFRNLHCIHEPQLYQGSKRTHPMSEMLVLGSTGEFVHPGEYEALKAYEEDQRRREEAKQRRIEAFRKDREAYLKAQGTRPVPKEPSPPVPASIPSPTPPKPPPLPPRSKKRELTCRICGRKTREWVIHYGIDDTCECRICVYNKE